MKVSYKWLIELTGLDWSVEDVAQRLTNCGTACEEIEAAAQYMDKVVVGEVTNLMPVEGADKLRLASVNLGGESMDLVCGAPNVQVGHKVPVATIGAKLAGDMVIKKAKIRGVESAGMICSERELGLSDDHSGIMVLDESSPIGMPLAQHLDIEDYRLTFELTPNRPDSMSAIGIARDLAAVAGGVVTRPRFELKETGGKASDCIDVKIDAPDGCPRYVARVIRGIKIGKSPWWLRKRLLMSGIRPISNVVDITNYVMLECGHPLHAFDYDKFGSKKVVVRFAKKGEKFTTLDGREHQCTDDVLLITNGKEAVAAAGVMGGLESEVEDGTTNILLEAAYFDPGVIRRSRRVLDTVSESSQRFEKGADPNGIDYAIDRAAYLLAELAGGEVLEGVVDAYPKKIDPIKVELRPKRCNDLLGTELSTERMQEILRLLEFEVNGDNSIVATVPTFRPDIEREVDLIEEVVRIHGFDQVEDAVSNIGPLFTPLHFVDQFVDEARLMLNAAGFDEMLHHGLADSSLASKLHPDTPQLKIKNPSSADLNIMRNSLLCSAVHVISHNISHRNLDLRLFEIGKAYFPPNDKNEWIEEQRILLTVTGSSPNTWRESPRPYDFYDLTGAIERLADHFHWPRFAMEPAEFSYLEKGDSYVLQVDGAGLGSIGRLSAKAGKLLDIKQPVWVAEFAIEPLRDKTTRVVEFRPLPVYPAAPRDLSLLLDADVPAGDIVETIRKTAGEIAEAVDIFDLYTGKQIEVGKKSVAVSIMYRSRSGSLSGEQVDAVQQKVIDKLKKQFNAEVRDK